jgi:GMP synthase-like glutamine amidotransferase
MKSLRIHYLQHVLFEKPGYIETWAISNHHFQSSTKLYENTEFPGLSEFDWLIIMGGPMGVYDEHQYSWLKKEKEFIKSSIKAGKTIIGICLGSQLLAEAMGARVFPNKKKEIGWFPVSITESGTDHHLIHGFPSSIDVLHWHGDTFNLPKNAVHLFQTDICTNQAFLYNNNILGLQFHLEATPDTLHDMLLNCRDELVTDDFIQSENEIIRQAHLCKETNRYLSHILNYLADSS